MRIVVKNLPLKTTKSEIESHFSKFSPPTDVYMLLNSSNTFRRICFIGYSSSSIAETTANYFNNTYFNNHKITIEMAKESDSPAQNSETRLRRALYSRKIVVNSTDTAVLEALPKYGPIENIELKEKVAIVTFKKGEDAERTLKEARVIGGKRVRIGNYVEKPCVKQHYNSLFFDFETVVSRTCEQQGIDRADLLDLKSKSLGTRMALNETELVAQTKQFLASNKIFLDKISGKSKDTVILRSSDILGVIDMVKGDFTTRIAPSKCLALLKFKTESQALACLEDLNMRRHRSGVIYCEFAPVTESFNIPEASTQPVNHIEEKKLNKMIIKNVPFQASTDELKEIFSKFSHVVDVRLPVKTDGTPRGFAFVTFDTPKSVDEAIEHFGSSTHLYGRRLVLERAKI